MEQPAAPPTTVPPITESRPEHRASTMDAVRTPLTWPALLLFAAAFLAMAVPYHPRTGWNVNTRLALVFAVVEQGTVAIDDYHASGWLATDDKAFFDGHFYSDKVFGVSLLGLPVHAAGHLLLGEALSPRVSHWLMTMAAVALPGGASAVLFFLLLARTGTPPRWALLLTAFSLFGTMWFGYGTLFMPYAPGLACLLGALWVTLFPSAHRVTVGNSFAVGLLLGGAMLMDFIFGLAVLGVGAVWLARVLDQTGLYGQRAFAEMKGDRTPIRGAVKFLLAGGFGGMLPLAIFFGYCRAIFGEFAIPYEYEVNERFREGMSAGFMGVTTPKLLPLWYITFHPFRGIFIWSPIVLAGVVGCLVAMRQYGKRLLLGVLGLYCFIAYLLFNAGYYMWWGGWTMGPRLLIPMLPFVMLGAGELLREGKLTVFERRARWVRPVRATVVLLGVLGLLLSMPLSLTDPQIGQGNADAALSNLTFADKVLVPQFVYLNAFYRGDITLWPGHRLAGSIGGVGSRTMRVAGIAGYLLLIGALLALAGRLAPAKLPGMHRQDYPFRTVDGTAAPPPPIP